VEGRGRKRGRRRKGNGGGEMGDLTWFEDFLTWK